MYPLIEAKEKEAITMAISMQGVGPLDSLVTRLVSRANDPLSTAALDSHTLPIIFGAIGVVLALASIIIGVIQIRAMSMTRRRASGARAGENAMAMGDVSGQDAENLAPS